MTPHRAFFVSYEAFVTPVKLADGNIIWSAGVGIIEFIPVCNGVERDPVGFTRVLHVPELNCNLLIVFDLLRRCGFSLRAENDLMTFWLRGELMFQATSPIATPRSWQGERWCNSLRTLRTTL